MKILFVTARYPPLMGGTEIHTHEVARAMAGLGHHVAVLTTDRTGDLPASESVEGVQIRRVRAHPRHRDYYVAPAAVTALRNEQPDLVHVQGYHTALAPMALRVLRQTDRPFVLSFHSGGAATKWRRMLRPVQQRALAPNLRRAQRLIAVSEFERRLFADRLDVSIEAIDVVPNGVHELMSRPLGIERNPNLICSVGRMEQYKNHHLTIGAFAAARLTRPDLQLVLVGDGAYRQNLIGIAEGYGLSDSIRFEIVPPQDRQRIATLFQSAALSVQASAYESEGIGVLEALAAGCRVVVADGTALSEQAVKEGVTSVPSPPSVDELAAMMNGALEAGPRSSVEPPRTWSDVTSDLLAIYEQVLR